MAYKYPRKPIHDFRVGRSIAGLGLFATEDIEKDDFIIEYWGPILTDEEADKKGGAYLFEVDTDHTINGTSRENTARYLNHSCKPNCEAEIDGKRVFIYAKRNIKAGEELTYHYGKSYYEDYIKPNGCKCGNHKKK